MQSIDVGRALEALLYDDATAGQTYEIYGPKNYSMREIAGLVDREIFRKPRHVNVPRAILRPAAALLNRLLWWPMLSAEDVDREFIDQWIDPAAKTIRDLGIEPDDISNFTYHYLVSRPSRAGVVESAAADSAPARIPELILLRPAAGHGEGEEGREAVYPRDG